MHAGRKCADDERGGRVGNRGPPPRGRAGGPRRARPPPHPPCRPANRGGAAPPPPPRQSRWSPLPPAGPRRPRGGAGARPAPPAQAACSRRNRGEQAIPHQRARAPHGPRPETASEHEPERYGGHALHDQNNISDTRIVACPGRAEGRNEAEQPPAPLPHPAAQTGGAAHRPTPPTPPHPTPRRGNDPDAQIHPTGARNPKPGRGETGPGRPPPSTLDGASDRGRTRGGAQTAWKGPTSAQRRDRARCARHTTQGRGRGEADAAGAQAHIHTKGTRGISEGQPDRARGTHRPRGMAYQRARVRDTRTERPATHSAGHAGWEGGNGGGHNIMYRPGPPELAVSAAHTRTAHCTRQGSSGALRHAPAPRLGSHRASPRGSHWRQASSTGPAAPAPRATTH